MQYLHSVYDINAILANCCLVYLCSMKYQRLIVRAETKQGESRTPLTPPDAQLLSKKSGIPIWVERSSTRVYSDEEYRKAGCFLMPSGFWRNAGYGSLILGLKELPDDSISISSDHIFFSHSFREQKNAEALLSRFASGGGRIFDLETLEDSSARRLVAFGYWAGFVGAALGVAQYYGGIQGALQPFGSSEALRQMLREKKTKSRKAPPKIAITGVLGRAGRGALDLSAEFASAVLEIDQHNSSAFAAEIPMYDILVHCVGGSNLAQPILKSAQIRPGKTLSVIVDVTCDFTSAHNLLPFYQEGTTMLNPTRKIDAIDLIAIDHLPALLPKESSNQFSADLTPLLLEFLLDSNHPVWKRSLEKFEQCIANKRALLQVGALV